MRILSFLTLAVALFVSCSKPGSSSAAIAITHVTVINPADSSTHPNSTVLIVANKITAVADDGSILIPANTRIVDGSGKFLIPGLADMHIHLTGAGEPSGSREFMFPLLVANGITTVRDMGGSVELLKQLKKETESGKALGPQIFFTGPYLDGNPPSFQPSIVIETPEQALPAVRRLKAEGVDFIKVQSRLKPQPYLAIADAARQENIRFVGHVPDSISPAQASDAGQYSIEHLTGILLACSSQEDHLRAEQLIPPPRNETPRRAAARQRAWLEAVLDTYSPTKAKWLYSKFLLNGTWQVPTMPLLARLAYVTPATDLSSDPNMIYIPRNLLAVWRQGRTQALGNKTPADFALNGRLLEASRKAIRDMHAAGIRMMAGTDAAAPNVFPGFGLQESVADFVDSDFTPMEALQTATSQPAEFLGRAARQGSVAPGQRADLVLLDASPLDDIHNTRKIRAVILNGNFLDRAALDDLLNRAARFARM